MSKSNEYVQKLELQESYNNNGNDDETYENNIESKFIKKEPKDETTDYLKENEQIPKQVLKIEVAETEDNLLENENDVQTPYDVFKEFNEEKHIATENINISSSLTPASSTDTTSSLLKRKRISRNKRRHKCPQCEKSFKLPSDLKLHYTSHTTALYNCQICHKTFKQRGSLNMHMQVHTGEELLHTNDADDDIVYQLSKETFSTMNFKNKRRVIDKGRPTPHMKNLKCAVKSTGAIRVFNTQLYIKHPWLCGSEFYNKLFCWSCLLFSTKITIWNNFKQGFCDMTNIHRSIMRHEISEDHINGWIILKTFTTTRINSQIDTQNKKEIERHNETVKNNREILKRLIATTVLLAKQRIPFNKDSKNRGNYAEIIYTLSEFDEKLKNHLANSTAFSVLSDDIPNDLVQTIEKMLIEEIKNQITETKFVAVSVANHNDQLSITYRYVLNGTCYERFTGFFDSNSDISALVLKSIEQFGCQNKVIAQTYDGAVVKSKKLDGLQAKIKETNPDALFVYCHSDKLNIILSQTCSCIKECKIFFAVLNGIVSFFSSSLKRANFLDVIVKKRLPTHAPILSLNAVNIQKHYDDLLEFFDTILNNVEDWDESTIRDSTGYIQICKKFEFIFLLKLFSEIFHYTEIVCNILQSKQGDISYCLNQINNLQNTLLNIRNTFFNSLWNYCNKKCARTPNNEDIYYQKIFYEIVDCIIVQLKTRFTDFKKLLFLELADTSKLNVHSHTFPDDKLKCLEQTYATQFNFVRLGAELKVFYFSRVFSSIKSTIDLYKYLLSSEIYIAMPELFKLVSLILTIPFSSILAEHNFSVIRRINTYTENTTDEDKFSSLALICIEKELLETLNKSESFYSKVINEFCKVNNMLEFHYK